MSVKISFNIHQLLTTIYIIGWNILIYFNEVGVWEISTFCETIQPTFLLTIYMLTYVCDLCVHNRIPYYMWLYCLIDRNARVRKIISLYIYIYVYTALENNSSFSLSKNKIKSFYFFVSQISFWCFPQTYIKTQKRQDFLRKS